MIREKVHSGDQYSLCGNMRGLVGVVSQPACVSTRSRKSLGLGGQQGGVSSGETWSWMLSALVLTSRFRATISDTAPPVLVRGGTAGGPHASMSAPLAPAPGSLSNTQYHDITYF